MRVLGCGFFELDRRTKPAFMATDIPDFFQCLFLPAVFLKLASSMVLSYELRGHLRDTFRERGIVGKGLDVREIQYVEVDSLTQ